MKRIRKTTRTCKYNLNKIHNDYTVEVMNRIKGLDLVDEVPEKVQEEVHNTVQEAVTKTIPNERKCKKAKWLSEEDLQIAEKRTEAKAMEKEKDIPN